MHGIEKVKQKIYIHNTYHGTHSFLCNVHHRILVIVLFFHWTWPSQCPKEPISALDLLTDTKLYLFKFNYSNLQLILYTFFSQC
jgi:hypothetical protein